MRPNTQPSVTLRDVAFDWPDGTTALAGITATFGTGRTGLIGANGTGKSTLLRLIAGELLPTTGTVGSAGEAAYLPQTLSLRVDSTVSDLLGVRDQVDALAAIEAGSTDPANFDIVGDDWDVNARAEQLLGEAGLTGITLDRNVGTLSGGESMLVAISGLRLADTPISLLDEPTNNLDRDARSRLYGMVENWPGTLIVVSHDTALLELMDTTAELRDGELVTFGGPLSAYREHVEQLQRAAQRDLRAAEQVLKTEKRQRVEAETKIARSARSGKMKAENLPKILVGKRKNNAEASAGRTRTEADAKIRDARRAVDDAADLIREDRHIRIDLPDPDVPNGRRLAEIHCGDDTVVVQGPERVALTGPNGGGKTTLLNTLWEPTPADDRPYAVAQTERIGYLAQRLDGLDDAASVLENIRSAVPAADPHDIRAKLAQFLLRGAAVDKRVGDLSGGERFRVALAKLLLASPPVQFLVLDEPTNNLDLASVDQLVEALADYRGGLLVVSHDEEFLARLGVTRELRLDQGQLQVIDHSE